MDYPIAGNDDAIRSVRMILATIGQTVTQAQAEYEAKYARRKTAEEAAERLRRRPLEAAPAAAGEPSRGHGDQLPRRHRLHPERGSSASARLRPRSRALNFNYQLSTQNDYLYG